MPLELTKKTVYPLILLLLLSLFFIFKSKLILLCLGIGIGGIIFITPPKHYFLIYLFLLFIPTGLAPIQMGSFELQPIDFFWIFAIGLLTVNNLKSKERLWHGCFWDYLFLWIVVAVVISFFKSYDLLDSDASFKVFISSSRFLVFSATSYLLVYLIKKTTLEKSISFIFWTTIILVLFGTLEKILLIFNQQPIIIWLWNHLGILFSLLDERSRIVGIIGSPETYGLVLTQMIPLAFCYRFLPKVVNTSSQGTQRQVAAFNTQNWPYLKTDILLVLGLMVISMTGTRTAFIGLIFIFVIFFMLSRFRVKLTVSMIFFALMFFISFFYATAFWERFNELFNNQSGNWLWRQNIWKSAHVIWNREPWTGYGFGSFELVMNRYFGNIIVAIKQSILIKQTGIYDTACSLYLQLLTDLGIFGLIPFVLLFLQTLYLSLRTSLITKDPLEHNLAVMILAIMAWDLIYGITNGSIFLVRGATYLLISIFWIQLAILQILIERTKLRQFTSEGAN